MSILLVFEILTFSFSSKFQLERQPIAFSVEDNVIGAKFDATLTTALKSCTSVKTLNLQLIDVSLIPFDITEHIEELCLRYNSFSCDSSQLKIIKSCAKLKRLKLEIHPEAHLVDAINKLSNIESVCWELCDATNNTFVNEVSKLSKLKRLKVLTVRGYMGYTFRGVSQAFRYPQAAKALRLLTKNHSLEQIDISNFDPDHNFLKALNQFDHLKRCELTTYVEIPAASLNLVTKFDIENSGCIDQGLCSYRYIIKSKPAN